jgi:hypothetical protein
MLNKFLGGDFMDSKGYLYDALPYVYTIGGILAVLLSGELVGRASGLLLISAAMLVFHMRLRYRTERAEKAEVRLTATSKVLANTKRQLMRHAQLETVSVSRIGPA